MSLVDRNARVGRLVEQLGELRDGHVDGNGDDFGPRRHHLAHRLVAELDHRLDQVAVAFLQNAFFLTGFDQRVHGFGRMLRLLLGVLLGQRCHRKREAEDQRDRHGKVNEHAQHRHEVRQPFAPGAHEKYVRQQTIEDDDDEDEADRGLYQVERNPALLHEQHVADEHADGGHAELCQHRHRERGPFGGNASRGSTCCS